MPLRVGKYEPGASKADREAHGSWEECFPATILAIFYVPLYFVLICGLTLRRLDDSGNVGRELVISPQEGSSKQREP
jgi:hypothetical protein